MPNSACMQRLASVTIISNERWIICWIVAFSKMASQIKLSQIVWVLIMRHVPNFVF